MTLDGHLEIARDEGTVAFTLTVTNEGREAVELTFPSGKVADTVVRADGEPVWRWSDGRMFTQAIQTRCLAPDESVTQTMVWEAPRTGSYTAEASLAASDADLTVQRAFTV